MYERIMLSSDYDKNWDLDFRLRNMVHGGALNHEIVLCHKTNKETDWGPSSSTTNSTAEQRPD